MTVDKKKIYFCMFLRLNNLFVTVNIGGQYRVQKYRGTPSNFRVIESFFLQALRHVFVFRIDCSFKVVS